jgi:hypothetical protein
MVLWQSRQEDLVDLLIGRLDPKDMDNLKIDLSTPKGFSRKYEARPHAIGFYRLIIHIHRLQQ